MAVPSLNRSDALEALRTTTFDLLVIGGGITGAGVALDAAARGLSVALVERDDFASGTSSKSSKLIHGGLRYLQQREFRLVYEALHERQRILRNAPHLVRILPFLIPILSKDGLLNSKLSRALGSALWMYDLTGGARIGKLHRRVKKAKALEHMPTLREPNLAAAYLYFDAQADDARLTLTIARTAAREGATIINHTKVVALLKDQNGQACGATVEADSARFDVCARQIVNAAGVWSDEIRSLDEGSDPNSIRPAKGIHITVPWSKVRNDIAAIVPVPKDRRSIFVVPWGDITYIGTTDTDYDGSIDDPQCTPEDIAYLLNAMNLVVSEPLTTEDVIGTWAGLRPLISGGSVGEKTADLSRRHAVRRSDNGVITVTGGKLTTYRRMAADTVNVVMGALGRRGRTTTKSLRLLGAVGTATDDAHLAGRYGSEAPEILELVASNPALAESLVPGLPYIKAEAIHAVRHEMALTLDDVLSRRTRARLLGSELTARAAESVAQLLGPELGWDNKRIAAEASEYRASITAERIAGGLDYSVVDGQSGS